LQREPDERFDEIKSELEEMDRSGGGKQSSWD
jgi:hypothetical protein